MPDMDSLVGGQSRVQDIPIAVASWIAALALVLAFWAVIGRPAVLLPPHVVHLNTLPEARAVPLDRSCAIPHGGFSIRAPRGWKVQWHKGGESIRLLAPKPTIAAIVTGFDTLKTPQSCNPRLMDLRLEAMRAYYKPIRVEHARPVRLAGLSGIEYLLDDGRIHIEQIEIHDGHRRYVFSLAVPKGKLTSTRKYLYAVAASFKKAQKKI